MLLTLWQYTNNQVPSPHYISPNFSIIYNSAVNSLWYLKHDSLAVESWVNWCIYLKWWSAQLLLKCYPWICTKFITPLILENSSLIRFYTTSASLIFIMLKNLKKGIVSFVYFNWNFNFEYLFPLFKTFLFSILILMVVEILSYWPFVWNYFYNLWFVFNFLYCAKIFGYIEILNIYLIKSNNIFFGVNFSNRKNFPISVSP